MRVGAVLVLSSQAPCLSSAGDLPLEDGRHPSRTPLARVEVLGRSVLERTIARLQKTGIQQISLIGAPSSVSMLWKYRVDITAATGARDQWSAAELILSKHATHGVDTVVVMEIGPYAEIDLVDALRFHRDSGNRVTHLRDSQGPLRSWIVSSSSVRNSAHDCISPFSEDGSNGSSIPYLCSGYINRLKDARDLRRLVADAFLKRANIRPGGREIKPGVWMDEHAKVHPTARIVAPAYIGSCARVGPSTVITRYSNLERDVRVSAGTVVESSSVLPHTVVGQGLEVCNAIVNGNEFLDLTRGVAVRIDDRKWLRDIRPSEWPAPRPQPELDGHRVESLDLAHSQHLVRAVGRLSEVFKGEL